MGKIENKDSRFIIGQIQELYSETTYKNKKHKMQQEINKNLKVISQKLNLSVPLKMSSARDCYVNITLHTAPLNTTHSAPSNTMQTAPPNTTHSAPPNTM